MQQKHVLHLLFSHRCKNSNVFVKILRGNIFIVQLLQKKQSRKVLHIRNNGPSHDKHVLFVRSLTETVIGELKDIVQAKILFCSYLLKFISN